MRIGQLVGPLDQFKCASSEILGATQGDPKIWDLLGPRDIGKRPIFGISLIWGLGISILKANPADSAILKKICQPYKCTPCTAIQPQPTEISPSGNKSGLLVLSLYPKKILANSEGL